MTPQEAKDLGLKIIESDKTLGNTKEELIAKIKQLAPNLVNSDNQVDTKALNDLFDIANTTSNNQGYELTFAGKGLARAKADEETTKELKFEEAQSKNPFDTENVIIRGDNIDALKLLYKNYHQKIKMIYIDPPYNTKSENFVYNDNFKQSEAKLIEEFGLGEETSDFLESVYGTRSHSGWLSFMYPRLKIAKELLTDDGVIFISIDDNEQANLKIICDEIFGAENFVAKFTRKGSGGRQDSQHYAIVHEYVLCYGKSLDNFISGKMIKDDEKFPFYDSNKKNNYKTQLLRKWGENSKRSDRPNLFYPIPDPDGNDNYPMLKDNEEGCWRWGKETMFKAIKDGKVEFKKKNGVWVAYEKKFKPKDNNLNTKLHSTIIDSIGSSTGATLIKEMLDEKVFSYPKPVDFISHIIKLSNTNNNDIILDFFAGSGTTAHSVMQQNAEDGGKRKFILVQWDEKIDPKKSKSAYDFCKENKFEPVISSITIERVHRAGEKILQELKQKQDNKLDIGYKVFSLTDKQEVKFDEQQGQLKVVNQRGNILDTLFNMLCATCKTLCSKIEVIKENCIYRVDDEIYFLGKVSAQELAKYNDNKVNIDSMADIDLQSYLNLDIANKDNITIIY